MYFFQPKVSHESFRVLFVHFLKIEMWLSLPEYFSQRFANQLDRKELQDFETDVERKIEDDIPEKINVVIIVNVVNVVDIVGQHFRCCLNILSHSSNAANRF